MAGETYGSPGFAFSGAMEAYLLKQEELKHRAFMDNLTLKKELREEAADKQDAEIRREQLAATKEDRATRATEARRKTFKDSLSEMAPGDIVDPSTIDEGKSLGVPVRLGPIPQKPDAGVPPALAEDPSTIANTPMAPNVGRAYAGTPQQEAGKKLLDTLQPGSPERTAVEYEMATGRPLPAGVLRVAPKPTPEPSFIAVGPDGKEISGIVSMTETGGPLLDGAPLPQGVTVRRAPTPRDPLLDRLTQSEIDKNRNAPTSTPVFAIGPDGKLMSLGDMPRGGRIGSVPGATAQAQKTANLETGKAATGRLKSDLEEADAAGLLGPASGRIYNLMAKTGTTGDAKKDALIGRLKGDILLTKMHVDAGIGGTRAASSPLLLKNWEDIALSGSKDLLLGYVKAIEGDMGAAGGGANAAPKKSLDELWNAAVGAK